VFGTGGQGANLRAEPSTGAAVLQTVPDGTALTVIGPDREAGGRTWRNVRTEGGQEGWLVDEAVRSLEAPTPAPTETPTPAPAATATPSPAAPATAPSTPRPTDAPSESTAPSVTPTATPSPGGTPAPPAEPPEGAPSDEPEGEEEPTPGPERVEVYGTGGTGANLRAQPGRTGSVLKSVPDGSQLTVVGEDEVADGVTWRHVETEDGLTGWLASEVIQTVIPPTPTPRPGSAGIGAPLPVEALPESELSEEQRAARPCRPGQLKGDAATGLYYPPDHPDYPGLLQRVRCFDDEIRARASGYRPPEAAPEPSPSPEP
jgi:SH3-like domain-containing protein